MTHVQTLALLSVIRRALMMICTHIEKLQAELRNNTVKVGTGQHAGRMTLSDIEVVYKKGE